MFKVAIIEKPKLPIRNFALRIKPTIPSQYVKGIINYIPIEQKGELALAA